MKRIFVLVLSFGLLITACSGAIPANEPGSAGEAGQSEGVYPPPTQTVPVPESYLGPGEAPAPASPHGELPAGAVIRYSRSGGLAGVDEEWVIFPDGRVTAKDGTTQQIPGEAVTALLAGLEGVGFFTTPGYSSPKGTCADCFTYSLVVMKDGQVYSAQVLDGDSGVPKPVQDALALVSDFLQ